MLSFLCRQAAEVGLLFALVGRMLFIANHGLTFFCRRELVSLVAVAMVLSGAALNADELVTVSLASGRQFTGRIDSQSDASTLWLVRGDEQMTIARPVAWERITQAQRGGESLAVDDLRREVLAIPAAPPPEQPVQPLPRWRGAFASPAPLPVKELVPLPPVRSIAIDASYANWDADVEADGLVLTIYPLAADGMIVPVDGALEVELLAPELRRFIDAPQGRGLTIERIASWTQALHAADFGAGGMRVELPFQALHPEFDTKVLPHGLVHARLTVPGQGVFDTTADFVRLRPWSPLRDNYWSTTGQRFFPSERTGRPKQAQ